MDNYDDAICKNDTILQNSTYKKIFVAKNLEPFTDYRFKLTLTNYYCDQEFIDVDQYGPGMVYKTDVGVPSKPENLEVQALTPNLATIDWSHSKIWNANYVRYRIFWESLNGSIKDEGEKAVIDGNLSTYLQPLLAGRRYRIYVRAYPDNYTNVYNQSDERILTMYPVPSNLTTNEIDSQSINITWLPFKDLMTDYTLEYAQDNQDTWTAVREFSRSKNNEELVYRVKNLKANTFYKFRLILRYRDSTMNYMWPEDNRFTFKTLGKDKI